MPPGKKTSNFRLKAGIFRQKRAAASAKKAEFDAFMTSSGISRLKIAFFLLRITIFIVNLY